MLRFNSQLRVRKDEIFRDVARPSVFSGSKFSLGKATNRSSV